MLSQIIEFTENNINEQTDGVLNKTASLFEDLAHFLNVFDVTINKTISTNDYYVLVYNNLVETCVARYRLTSNRHFDFL